MNDPKTLRQHFPFRLLNKATSEVIWEYAVPTPDEKSILVTSGTPADVDNPSLEIGCITLESHMKLVQ